MFTMTTKNQAKYLRGHHDDNTVGLDTHNNGIRLDAAIAKEDKRMEVHGGATAQLRHAVTMIDA